MTGVGMSLPDFTGLVVHFDRQPWDFVLRRADFAPYAGFGDLHRAGVDACRVAHFLPNWKTLAWIRIPDNLITRAESWAHDLPYQVNIRGAVDSRLSHDTVAGAFLRFMAHSEG